MPTQRQNQVTLLVHYTAPATVKHDRKWQQIAKSVINFDNARTEMPTNLFENNGDTPTSGQSYRLRNKSSNHNASVFTAGYAENFASQPSLDDQIKQVIDTKDSTLCQKYGPRLRGAPRRVYKKYSTRFLSRRCRQPRVRAHNPYCSGPERGIVSSFQTSSVTSKGHITRAPRSEEILRARSDTTVLVSFSGKPARKSGASNSFLLSDSCKPLDQQINMIPSKLRSTCNSLTASTSDFTVDASKFVENTYKLSSSGHEHADSPTSGEPYKIIETDNPWLDKVPNCLLPLYFSTSRPGIYPDLHTATATKCRPRRTIDSLSLNIEAQYSLQRENDPNVVTIPRELRLLADRPKMWQRFHPERATRNLKNMERGYWKIIVKVTSPSVMIGLDFTPQPLTQFNETRFPHQTNGTIPGNYHQDSMKATGNTLPCPLTSEGDTFLWAEVDFVGFFERLEDFIKKGYASWATRLVIANQLASFNETTVELRVYVWPIHWTHMDRALQFI